MMSVCAGCGGPLPPRKSPAPLRKWCSERCRKRQYDRECIDCGARIDGTTPGRSKGRCRPCANKIPRPADLAHRELIESLWAQGKTIREICEALGHKYNTSMVGTWRSRGYNLPHRRSPEQLARITADNGAHLAKARRVWAEMKAAA